MADKTLVDYSIEELEKMLDDPSSIQKTIPDVPSQPTITDEPEPVTDVPAPVPAVPVEPIKEEPIPVEPAPDPSLMEAENSRLDEERRDAVIAKLEAHNSRLAGKIGELQKSQRQAGTSYPEIAADDERLIDLQRAVQEMKDSQRLEARSRAISEEVNSVLAKPYLKGVESPLLAAATQKFEAAWNEAIAEDDPDLARLNARTVLLSVAAEARRLQLDKVVGAAKERMAEQTRVATSAKLKASVSASGSAPQPPPQTALKDRSIEDLQKMLDDLAR